jgi:hypothetical protein
LLKNCSNCFLFTFDFKILLLSTVVVVIVWSLDLQLPLQSVPITKLWVWILLMAGCTRYNIMTGTLASSTNKADCHDITEILLKVALSTINQTKILFAILQCLSYQPLCPLFCNRNSMHIQWWFSYTLQNTIDIIFNSWWVSGFLYWTCSV